ncbi:adrenocorticotropic hormone receptor-like [Patiria miniata]|uniref:G-protein coupled receptors family 1 profile domain-containing protein n=1 Tax=Patiria miniata TaxID=46514 RepID=A0A914BJ26_PATMI|nr:adrenocorticotropic hormone receptor-like [Patiria miniata]
MAESVLIATKYSITVCCAIAIVENLLVIAVFAGTKKLRIKYYAFVFNLALADLMYAVLGIAITWIRLFILDGIYATSYTVSILTIFCAAINRYLALSIMPPARYDSLVTKYRLIGVCVLLWCFALAYGLLTYLVASPTLEVFDAITSLGYSMVVFIVWVITALAYFLAFRKIKQYTPPLASTAGISANMERDQTRVRQTRRLLILFVLILVTAFFSWMPYGILSLIAYFNPYLYYDRTYVALFWVGTLLYTLSNVINPLLYWWRLDGFKEGFYALFCRCVIKAEPRETEVERSENENTVADTGV